MYTQHFKLMIKEFNSLACKGNNVSKYIIICFVIFTVIVAVTYVIKKY